ncbi:BamA/TamA family outer membrane protein [Planktothrix pseudagardhii]|uniref:Outer envelope protein 80, chloroplastic n=1 Tax=Planktothrix pseudagardhii TaxID=132604 RepID=A0A9W4CKG0_9CYAN|nr:BamA/TamA family outer membrane protein [Planktothrix pseudagardhii]CAD5949378.1 Outer envelope protein 80, chloroplastic [Planktothrix pseudagardhii]
MRLSPVLVAVFAASATFGLSNSANGQTAYPDSESSSNSLGTLEPESPGLIPSETHDQSLAVNQIPPSTPIYPFEDIVLHKTKLLNPDLAFSLGQSIGKNISPSWVHSSFSTNSATFNPSQPLSDTSLALPSNSSELDSLSERPIADSKETTIILNKQKGTEDLVKIPPFSSEVSPEIKNPEINPPSNLEILLNKSATEKRGNFSFPVVVENAIALNSTVSETNIFEPSLNKELGKTAQFPLEVSQQIASAEINQSSNLEVLLNKSATEKRGNFSFPVISENAIALNPTVAETNIFQPSLNKELGKTAQFPLEVSQQIASAEINQSSNLEVLLNKSATEKRGNFSFPVVVENAIALNPTVSETNIFQPSLNKTGAEKLAHFSPPAPLEIAQATPETLPSNPEVPPSPPSQPDVPPTIPIPTTPAQAEPEVLVAEIAVSGTENTTLIDKVYSVISTQPGRTTTRSQLQKDINAIFATGLFRNVKAVPEDTPLGVRVTFEVEENPPLKQVVIEGDTVLPEEIINQSFADQYNQTINLNQIEAGVKKINQWYQDNGYVLAQVVAAPEVTREGVVTLQVAEGVIETIEVRFLNSDGEATDEEGKPIEGRTRDFIITREIQLKPGDVFNQQTAQRDLARVFGLGIFEDVRLQLEPGKDNPREATVIVNVIEKTTGSLAFGGGISSAAGLFGTLSYQEINLGGNNQRLGVELEAGNRVFQVDVSFTDPWIAGDPYRTSYTINAFRRRTISVVFEDGPREVRLANGDRPRVVRTGGGISFTRPFAENVFADPNWVASLGFQYQRVDITDSDGNITPTDEYGNQLSYSGSGSDDLLTVQFGLVRDRRNNKQQPTSGYLLRFGTEQSIPVGSGSILMNRLRAGYTFYVPVNFFTGFIPKGPQSFAFNFQAGTVVGNLPPYEAFPLGGTASVRGWEEGAIASTRSFVQGSIEYRFPIFSNFIGGALFVDGATDLNSQGTVPGSPGGVRDKPGSGFGYGAGVRLQTPLGPVRIDYGINNNGDSRIHFGLGERF